MPVQTKNLFKVDEGIEPGTCYKCGKSAILVMKFYVFFVDKIVSNTQYCEECLKESFKQNYEYFYGKK
jgi:hypothetical protein